MLNRSQSVAEMAATESRDEFESVDQMPSFTPCAGATHLGRLENASS